MIRTAVDLLIAITRKSKMPRKEVFYFFRYRKLRILFKRRGFFIGIFILYLLTLKRFLDRLCPTTGISDLDRDQFYKITTFRVMENL